MDLESLISLMEAEMPVEDTNGSGSDNVSRVYVGFLEQHPTLSITYLTVIFFFTVSGVIGNSLVSNFFHYHFSGTPFYTKASRLRQAKIPR